MEKETTISTNIDKTGENQQVVKGSESTAANNDRAANIEEIQRINRQIGQRIADIREKAGMNQADFYSLLYPNSREAPGTKNNRMGDIENARAFDGNDKKGKLIIDFARLLFISQCFQVSLDYLLYGKTEQTAESPIALPEEISTAPKKETIAMTELQTEVIVNDVKLSFVTAALKTGLFLMVILSFMICVFLYVHSD